MNITTIAMLDYTDLLPSMFRTECFRAGCTVVTCFIGTYEIILIWFHLFQSNAGRNGCTRNGWTTNADRISECRPSPSNTRSLWISVADKSQPPRWRLLPSKSPSQTIWCVMRGTIRLYTKNIIVTQWFCTFPVRKWLKVIPKLQPLLNLLDSLLLKEINLSFIQ